MERPRGTRVDEVDGQFEITYFGLYSASIQSQHLKIEHIKDLENIRNQITKLLEEKKDVSTEGKPEA